MEWMSEAKYLCAISWSLRVFIFWFFFFFDWKERKLREAKKTLMDEMLCTYGMENCAILSQKAASEECIMAAASQVPGPLAALYHCTMCVTLVLHSSRRAGRSHSGREKFLELLEPLLRPKMVPSFSPFIHTQEHKELNSSHLNFLPTSFFWLILLWEAAVFQLMSKLTHSEWNNGISL